MSKPAHAASTASPPRSRRCSAQMLELAMILRRRRFARGALELNMPEIEIDLGEQGQVTGAHLAVNDESHQVIEEFMLAANEAVATHLTDTGHRLPPPGAPRPRADQARRVRRVRPQPRPARSTSRRAGSSSSASSPRRPASPRNTPSTTACCAA